MLILKQANAFHIAARHYTQLASSHLDKADSELSRLKSQQPQFMQSRLDDAYPDKLFTKNSMNLERIEAIVEEYSGEEGATPRSIAHKAQQEVSTFFLDLESKVKQNEGVNTAIDRAIDEQLMQLMQECGSVTGFMLKSQDSRSERLQRLLDSPSPSAIATDLRIDFVQKDAADEILRELAKKVRAAAEEAEFSGDFDEEPVSESDVENAVSEYVYENFYNEAISRAQSTFEQQGSYKQLTETIIPQVTTKVIDKLHRKVQHEVDEIIAEEMPSA